MKSEIIALPSGREIVLRVKPFKKRTEKKNEAGVVEVVWEDSGVEGIEIHTNQYDYQSRTTRDIWLPKMDEADLLALCSAIQKNVSSGKKA